jgi:NADH-quinone oxidoreductase subunit H
VTAILVKSAVLIALLLGAFAYVMVLERKFLGYFQLRLGPNRVGPWGLAQPMADGLKLALKQDMVPETADPLLYRLAPAISLFVALAAFAAVPLGPRLGVASPNAGLLYVLAVASLGVWGLTLGGWASQSKYALLGSLRSTAQMISYELALGLSILGVVVASGSVDLRAIVAAQAGHVWFVFPEIVGFAVFVVCAVADTNRAPFDLPEAETELVAGYHTEYSGLRFAMFYMAEYINVLLMSALGSLLFLGGWSGPAVLPPVAWLLIKMAGFVFLFVWLRATFPRLRYDRLMTFGWKVLVPLAFLNLAGAAVVVAFRG